MVQDIGITADMDYSVAESEFVAGNVAMTINGPWGWANIEKAGVDYGVATLPKFNGKASKPFVGVWADGISTATCRAPTVRFRWLAAALGSATRRRGVEVVRDHVATI